MNIIERFKDRFGLSARLQPLEFPPPFQGMFAINSDVEWTSWQAQLDLLQFFDERGLETAFSYWFFGDPNATWRLFESNGDFSPEAPAALDLIRAGFLDTLHSFGGITTGVGTAFGRADIAAAYERMRRAGAASEIYSNHGTVKDIQNVGGPWTRPKTSEVDASNYQEGDVIGSTSYHLDLTARHGTRFYWLDVDLVPEPVSPLLGATPDKGLFTQQRSRDGTVIIRYRRTACGLLPLPPQLAGQIDAVLASPAGGYTVLYNHLGADRRPNGDRLQNKPPYLSGEAFAALDRLGKAQDDGRILVTTTARLLNYAFMQLTKPWSIRTEGKRVTVELFKEARWGEATLPMEWKHYEGLTFRCRPKDEVMLSLAGETRRADRWDDAGGHYAGLLWRKRSLKQTQVGTFRAAV